MADNPPPVRKFGPREFAGMFGTMATGFGVYSWVMGREVPWGYQQTYGASLFGVGLLVAAAAMLWPRRR